MSTGLTLADVEAAATRLAGVADRTPVLRSSMLDERGGAPVLVKAESFQRTGSFKFRGAYNAIARLGPSDLARGVVTASSGNHAQAVALVARLFDTRAVVVMPHDAPAAKRAATAGHGAEILEYDRYDTDRDALLAELASQRGLVTIPPDDHLDVMAGQGTVALEVLEDCTGELGPPVAFVVPVGGGGLAAGCSTVVAARAPGCEVVGVEPVEGDDTRRSLAAGERVTIPVPRTIADGQQLTTPGQLTFEVNRRLLARVEVVTDDQIVEAMRFCFERLRIVVEPSGASALAAVLAGQVTDPGGPVVVVLSGANIDVGRFVELVDRSRDGVHGVGVPYQ